MRTIVRSLALGLAPLLLWSCGSQGIPKEGRVLAVVNGVAITEASLEREIAVLPPYVRPIAETPGGRVQFLESLITRDLLVQEALRRGLDRRPEVRDRIEQVRRSVILEALFRDVTEEAPGLSDAALKKFYDENAGEFEVGARVRVSHLLFKDKTRAEALMARARAGATFDALRGEVDESQGETAADLGLIEKGRFIKEFEDSAFAARPGSVVGPVRTMYGYHVIWVGERKPAGIQSFEEVKGKIVSELREQAQREAVESLAAKLKTQARIQVMAEPPGPPGRPAAAAGAPARTPAVSGESEAPPAETPPQGAR